MHDLISDLVAFLQVLVTMIWNMEKTQLDVDSRIVLLSDIKTPASCDKVWDNLKKEPEAKKKKKGVTRMRMDQLAIDVLLCPSQNIVRCQLDCTT